MCPGQRKKQRNLSTEHGAVLILLPFTGMLMWESMIKPWLSGKSLSLGELLPMLGNLFLWNFHFVIGNKLQFTIYTHANMIHNNSLIKTSELSFPEKFGFLWPKRNLFAPENSISGSWQSFAYSSVQND